MSITENPFHKTLNIAATYIEAEAGIQLRDYQRAAVEAIFMSVVRRNGLTIVVEMARQGGKNELQAQIQALLLILHSFEGGEIVIPGAADDTAQL